jgi:iron complex transport system permease protein
VALVLALFGASPFASQWLLRLGLTGAGFVGAVFGVLLTLVLANGVLHTLRLLLAGVIVGVVLGAARDLVTMAVPDVLQAMQAFILGSTGFIGWSACGVMLALLLPLLALAWALGRMLDGLALGEATAASLGLPLGAMRAALVAVLALATGAAVAQTGLIAFVGLAAPHLVRSIAPTPHGRLIVLASLLGGLLLMTADVLARWLVAPQELPVGVLTAVLGGSYLLWLMHRRSRQGGGFA